MVERTAGHLSVMDVLDRVLDKGIIIDAWVRLSLVGIDLISLEVRVVVASLDTYIRHADELSFISPVAPRAPVPPGGRRRRALSRAA